MLNADYSKSILPYALQNTKKADFTKIYNESTPHSYFSKMKEVKYVIPDQAKPYLTKIIDFLNARNVKSDPMHILDFGCSYGVLAALLKQGYAFHELQSHYAIYDGHIPSRKVSLERDKRLLSKRPTSRALSFTGVDQAEEAISYALETGLLDVGISHDFEAWELPAGMKIQEPLDLIVSTGCVGYVGETAFRNLFSSLSSSRPWVACFVLRMFDYAPIAQTLDGLGYMTHHFQEISLQQRPFTSPTERRHVIERVRELGKITEGKEDAGFFYADLFVSLPKGDAEVERLSEFFTLEHRTSIAEIREVGP